jgi:hypothetical protein
MKSIRIGLPPEFAIKCEDAGISPEEVIEAFIRDLCALDGSNGSDERDLAQSYFDRCGYDWRSRVRRRRGRPSASHGKGRL